MTILYLHGFRSSPQSAKALYMAQRMQALGLAADYHCPQLPASPRQAIDLSLELARHLLQQTAPNQLTIVGSSLGGFYATWLAEQLACRAVLLNPAVTPPHDLEQYVGITTQFHSDQPFEFKREYIAELEGLVVSAITQPERYFLIAATGDEVLDWRQMVAFYAGARQHVIQGSDHGLSDFPALADEVLRFCQVEPPVSGEFV